MKMNKLTLIIPICFMATLSLAQGPMSSKPRVVISSDIGGTDPDDFQSMIHLLMYADIFEIEGLISSPYGDGRKGHFIEMIDLYKKDLKDLRRQAPELPKAEYLKGICKQGTISGAPFKGYQNATEGSDWIVKCAKKQSAQPLWILVWGGLEDLAQALYDAPEIKDKVKVYWIGGPNKKWSANAYSYIAGNHPDLWFIEANATYRGWFMDKDSPEKVHGDAYYNNFIKGRGALGQNFKNHYNGRIKMGDTPSLAYLMNGDPNSPEGESWGGSFVPINRSTRYVFERNTTKEDTIVAYGIIEWIFKGPVKNIPEDSVCFTIKIQGQVWPGYYLGDGRYGTRYSSKRTELGNYESFSKIQELDGQKGQYVSITPWPGKPGGSDYILGKNWYSDRSDINLYIDGQQGVKTVSKYREEFLMDWAERWGWLKNK